MSESRVRLTRSDRPAAVGRCQVMLSDHDSEPCTETAVYGLTVSVDGLSTAGTVR